MRLTIQVWMVYLDIPFVLTSYLQAKKHERQRQICIFVT